MLNAPTLPFAHAAQQSLNINASASASDRDCAGFPVPVEQYISPVRSTFTGGHARPPADERHLAAPRPAVI